MATRRDEKTHVFQVVTSGPERPEPTISKETLAAYREDVACYIYPRGNGKSIRCVKQMLGIPETDWTRPPTLD